MKRYIVVALVVTLLVLGLLFVLSEDDVNMPFVYGLF